MTHTEENGKKSIEFISIYENILDYVIENVNEIDQVNGKMGKLNSRSTQSFFCRVTNILNVLRAFGITNEKLSTKCTWSWSC